MNKELIEKALKLTQDHEEIWKDIKGYEGKYQISSMGNIRTLVYNGRYIKGKKMIRLISPRITNSGYKQVTLHQEYGKKHMSIHRLVAQAFIPNPENKLQVNHKNGIKEDNRIDNLEWNTRSENQKHRFTVLGYSMSIEHRKITSNLCRKNFSKEVIKMDLKGNDIESYYSASEASRRENIARANISACCTGKQKTAGGFTWRYTNNQTF